MEFECWLLGGGEGQGGKGDELVGLLEMVCVVVMLWK